jgi:hypothetical protein
MYTVVVRESAANRRRAIVAAVLSLALTTALAATLVNSKRVLHLGNRQAPRGWPVSFQPPDGWQLREHTDDYLEFVDLRDPANPKQFVTRILAKPSDLSAADVAVRQMTYHFLRLGNPEPIAPAENGPLGSLPGACVNMPATGDYVHAGVPPADPTRVVVIEYHTSAPFSEGDKRMCAKLIAAVQLAAPAS